jgi:hypothetical protein
MALAAAIGRLTGRRGVLSIGRLGMDINLARRKCERKIAADVASEFLRAAPSTAGWPPELLAHHFGVVCERLEIAPTEAEAKRILKYVSDDIARLRRKADILLKMGAHHG